MIAKTKLMAAGVAMLTCAAGGYWLGHRVERSATEQVRREWSDDKARYAQDLLDADRAAVAREATIRQEVLGEMARRQISIDAVARDVRALSSSVRLCSQTYQAAGTAPASAGVDGAGSGGQPRDAVEVLQELAADIAERADREAVRSNALREWVRGVTAPTPDSRAP